MINIQSMLSAAMKNKEAAKVNAYRNVKAKFLEAVTAKGGPKELDTTAQTTIINKMIKELQEDIATINSNIDTLIRNNDYVDSVELINKRIEARDAMKTEVNILLTLVPKAASKDDICNAINAYIAQNGDFTQKQMGLVVKFVKSQFDNVDGKMVADQIKEYINRTN